MYLTASDILEAINEKRPNITREMLKRIVGGKNKVPQCSLDKPIPLAEAKAIVRAVTGRDLELRRFKERQRGDGGPLQRQDLSEELSWITYNFDGLQESAASSMPFAIGFACSGGFLAPNVEQSFRYCVGKGCNILIGDRGSGKSTVLSLLGIICDSAAERTGVLATEIMYQLANEEGRHLSTYRQIRKKLWELSILRFASFYFVDGSPVVFCMLPNIGYDYFMKDGDWRRVAFDKETPFPKVKLFRQGDIFRISEHDDRYVFNKLLDGLEDNMGVMRSSLAKTFSGVAFQVAEAKTSFTRLDRDALHRTTQSEYTRLYDLKRIQNNPKSGALLAAFIEDKLEQLGGREANIARMNLFDVFSDPTIFSHHFIYLPIRNFLYERVGNLRYLEGRRLSDELEETFEFIFSRIRLLNRLFDQSDNLPIVDEACNRCLLGIANFIDQRQAVSDLQREACAEATRQLKEAGVDVKLHTPSTFREQESTEDLAQICRNAKSISAKLNEMNISAKSEDISLLISRLRRVRNVLSQFEGLGLDPNAQHLEEMLYDPVVVQMHQGSILREFDHLSFGQKAAIILMIALQNMDADILIIDQPEDHLDVAGVVELLAPTMQELGKTKAISIATHSDNLVFGMLGSSLTVMESSGESGHIAVSGTTGSIEVAKAMLRVLAGGEDAFLKKFESYSKFVVHSA